MSHLDEGSLHALLDGEVAAAEVAALERHLAACDECRTRLAEARSFRDESLSLIEALDEESTPVLAEAAAPAQGPLPRFVAERVEIFESPAPRNQASRRPTARWVNVVALAATVVVAVGLWQSLGGRKLALPDGPERASIPLDSSTSRLAATPPPAPAEPAPFAGETRANSTPDRKEKPRTVAQAAAPAPPVAVDRQPRSESVETIAAAPRRDLAVRDAQVLYRTAPSQPKIRPVGPDTIRQVLRARPLVVAENAAGIVAGTRRISADSAIRVLGGSIRLIDGLTPDRYEQDGLAVRVVYQTSFGLLTLVVERSDNGLVHRLVAPPKAPADSISAWEERIH